HLHAAGDCWEDWLADRSGAALVGNVDGVPGHPVLFLVGRGFDARVEQICAPDEVRVETSAGPFIDFPGGPELLDEPPIHQCNTVGHVQSFVLVVSQAQCGASRALWDLPDVRAPRMSRLRED